MKNLASEMQSKSSILSLALSLSTIVILLGIFGLVVVANHRQKKREQLKAILRAKNLGPVLESRKIASEVGNNFLPKYTQVRKSTSSSIAASPTKPKKFFKSSLPAALTSPRSKTAAELAAIDGKFQNRLKKLDFNEFLSGLLYRVRKGEFTPEHGASAAVGEFSTAPPPPPPIKYTTPALPPPPPPKKPPPMSPPQTSFFYKEGSLTESESSTTSSSATSSCGDVIRETVEVEVNKRRSPKSGAKGAPPPSSAISSGTSTSSDSSGSSLSRSSSSTPGSARKIRRQQESRSGSYMSKISQQVFVHEPNKARSAAKDSASTSTGSTGRVERGAKSTPAAVIKQQKQQDDLQGELKEKCMTFFSSVTRTKADIVSDKTKL